MKYIIVLIFILCLIGCSVHPKKTKCENGFLYEQLDDNSQIYTIIKTYGNYTQCIN
mgnify:CR=1 FL=1